MHRRAPDLARRARVGCAVLAALLAPACAGAAAPWGAAGAEGADAQLAVRAGQPTARDLAFLVGGWQFEGGGALTTWEVWRRSASGFEGAAWQASRGVSRQTERLDLVLTLDGWVLSIVLLDDFEREYTSEPFDLAAWGDGWVRFAARDLERPRELSYRAVEPGVLEVAASAGDGRPAVRRARAMPD
jgi:hypothetical protein